MESLQAKQLRADRKSALVEATLLLLAAIYAAYMAKACTVVFRVSTTPHPTKLEAVIIVGVAIGAVSTIIFLAGAACSLLFAIQWAKKDLSLIRHWFNRIDGCTAWDTTKEVLGNGLCLALGVWGLWAATQQPYNYPSELAGPLFLLSAMSAATSFIWLLVQILRIFFFGRT